MNKIVLLFFIGSLSITAQHQNTSHDTLQDNHEFKHFRAAINIAHGHILTSQVADNNFIVIPAWGFDFQYWFNSKIAIGLKGDIEIANYVIESNGEEKQIERENPFILSLPFFYSPWKNNGLQFFIGPGIEIEKNHNFFVMRFGAAYDFHLPNNWDIAPELIYDLKDGYLNVITFGVGVGKRF